jgi:hypothetical protein
VNSAASQSLAKELNCVAAAELKAVTASSEVIITVVTDDRAMKQIYADGLLVRAKRKLFLNCATVMPAIHRWVEQKCEACMVSSITQTRQGSRYLMCGGKPEVFEHSKPTASTCRITTTPVSSLPRTPPRIPASHSNWRRNPVFFRLSFCMISTLRLKLAHAFVALTRRS